MQPHVRGGYGSGTDMSRSELVGRAVGPLTGELPTILANTSNVLENLGNTFFSKAVLNGVPLKNRASYMPSLSLSSSGNKLLMSGDNPDNPAQSSILNSYAAGVTPYGRPDFYAPKPRVKTIDSVLADAAAQPQQTRRQQPRGQQPTRQQRQTREQRRAKGRPYHNRRSLAADSPLSVAKVPILNTVNPLALPAEASLMMAPSMRPQPFAPLPPFTRPTRDLDNNLDSNNLDNMVLRGGILGFLGGLIGGFDPPTSSNTSISYTTSVSDKQSFQTSLSAFNQTINQYILNQTVSTQSEIANIANVNIVDLSGRNVTLNLSNAQNITFLNMAKLNVTDVNQFVLSQSTAIFDSILSSFQASNTASLMSIATAQNNSNLIDSILHAPKQTDNINNTITLNTSVQTAFDSEKNAVYQNLANNSTVRNFAQNFMVRLQQTFNLNVSKVSATEDLSVIVNNTQAINSTLDIVTQLDLSTAVFNTINLSDTFKIDKSVTAVTQATASATTSSKNTSETVGSAIQSVGKAAGEIVSSATLSVIGPVLAGLTVLAIGGGAAIYFIGKSKKAPPTKKELWLAPA